MRTACLQNRYICYSQQKIHDLPTAFSLSRIVCSIKSFVFFGTSIFICWGGTIPVPLDCAVNWAVLFKIFTNKWPPVIKIIKLKISIKLHWKPKNNYDVITFTIHTGLWWGNLKERDQLEEADIDGRIRLKWLKWIFKISSLGRSWTELCELHLDFSQTLHRDRGLR